VARQLLQAAPAREVGLGRAEMQAQFLLAAEDLGGATQRAIVNIVKHSPSPLAGCHFSKLDLVRRAQIASRAARRQSSRAKFFSRPRACWKKVADVFLSSERRIKPLCAARKNPVAFSGVARGERVARIGKKRAKRAFGRRIVRAPRDARGAVALDNAREKALRQLAHVVRGELEREVFVFR